jgi:hypothetical protein
MIRVPAHARSLVRITALCASAGIALASCATSTSASNVTPRVTGLPAISISVPLSSVACTTDNSCVAIGTSNLDVSPTSVGEDRSASGHWSTITVPSADTSTYIQSSSCWSDGCLFVGSQSNADLVWRYDAASHTIEVVSAPTGASGISAVSCYAAMTCAILDAATGGSRILFTDDGGTTWSAPQAVGVAAQDTASSLSCTSATRCIASFLNSSNGILVAASVNGVTPWTTLTNSSTLTWGALTSLNCVGRKCLGLAKLFTGWRIVRTDNFGKSWSKVSSLSSSILTLACTSLGHCVVGGEKDASPWLATVVSKTVTPSKLKYVPSPIIGVACGSKVCAAIGVTTVVTLKP